jgi:hypothetical protein
MLSDTYNAGSSWVPLRAKEDSYAVITGCAFYVPLYAPCHALQSTSFHDFVTFLSYSVQSVTVTFLPLCFVTVLLQSF